MASRIEWTTWNPVTGCTKVSQGCEHCYAERFSERFRGVPGHPYEMGFDLTLSPERLDHPLRWKKPRLGVSVEDQKRTDERIPLLLETPAAVRFVSAEPLLGMIDFGEALNEIDWVIVGGESGPGARPMNPDWVRSIRDQCRRFNDKQIEDSLEF